MAFTNTAEPLSLLGVLRVLALAVRAVMGSAHPSSLEVDQRCWREVHEIDKWRAASFQCSSAPSSLVTRRPKDCYGRKPQAPVRTLVSSLVQAGQRGTTPLTLSELPA